MTALHRPVLTLQERAPWSWVTLVNLAWFGLMYSIFVTSVALPLTMLRFTDDSRLIAFVTSVGAIAGIVIGPVCNYISDRLWTRFGRRRPFLLVAMTGTLTAMLLTPYMPSLVPLVLLTVISSLLGDIGSTFEPLWLEIIPPSQRGRGFVMRSVAIQLASLYFFQVMFAQWDNRYSYDWSAAGLGTMTFNGEQLTYLAAALLNLYTIGFLFFMVRETRPRGVDLKPWRQLDFNPITFIRDFMRNVFGDRRWWRVYLFYVAPSLITSGGNTFGNLMLVDQWGYGKGSIALMGLPVMLVSLMIAAPLIGRQSDRFTIFPRWLLGGVMLAAAGTLLAIVKTTYGGLDPLQLPPFWAMLGICVCTAFFGMSAVFWVTQELNRLSPRQNPRLWPWLLNPVFLVLGALVNLAYVRWHMGGATPPISHWFLLGQITGCMGAFGALAGPLLYDYMPADKIGTLSSGFGLLSTALTAFMANFMGFWIFYFTLFTGGMPDGGQDYSSSMYVICFTAPVSLGLMLYFFFMARRGLLVEYGKLKLLSDGRPAAGGEASAH